MQQHPITNIYWARAKFFRLDQAVGLLRGQWLVAACLMLAGTNGSAQQPEVGEAAARVAEQDFAGSFGVPSAAESYNVARGILLAADVRDPSPQGTRAKKAAADEEVKINLQEITVKAKRYTKVGPNSGLALTREEIPGNVQTLTAEDIKRSNSLSIADLMNSQLQSVTVNDYQGNPFQMDVQYRGFTASPQLGTSQGLSVFLDGIRVNEPFGDVVNWDMIPMNALASLDVIPGSNPLYGLGTLGGALSMRTKNGFDNAGVEMKTLTGSFGRKQFLMSAGANNGVVGGFIALNLFDEDGWRDNSPSKVNQGFVKLDYRTEKLNLNFSSLFTGNDLVGNGLLPTEMYKKDPSQIFSSPDETQNRLQQFQLSGEYFVNEEFSITGQVYRRRSQRKGFNGDINEDFNLPASRIPNPGEKVACGFADNNADGLPDYSVGTLGTPAASRVRNAPLPEEYVRMIRQGMVGSGSGVTGGGVLPGGGNSVRYSFRGDELINSFESSTPIEAGYFYDENDVQQFIYFDSVVNNDPNDPNSCVERDESGTVRTKLRKINRGDAVVRPFILPIYDANGRAIQRDGAGQAPDGKGTGYVAGTPNALITKTAVAQVTDGANMQLNWNLEKHKFMVGASVDSANSSYEAQQFLSVLDATRHVSLNPSAVAPEFYAASNGIGLNDFAGTSITKSLYASETWSPVETFHVTAAARYNYTRVRNILEVRQFSGDRGPGSFLGTYETAVICPSSDPASCPDAQISYDEILGRLSDFARDPETEMFKYRSFNPALGAAWQTTPELNVYANWNRGARTPSVIELGCALDDTPVNLNRNPNEPPVFVPRSIAQNRFCSLPSTLAGDPYLEQVRSETKEFGLRGQWGANVTWNATAYRTDLQDDIYFVSFRPERSFFQNIGNTRRQGVEMGLSGKYGKLDFRLNYSITDATFQDEFDLASPNNSQADPNEFYYGEDPYNPGTFKYLENPKYGTVRVKKGNRLPGIPLQNMNANISYQLTPKWRVGLTMVAHSRSYVRGNENNAHRPGPATSGVRFSYNPNTLSNDFFVVDRPDWLNEGSLPGYATFNFSTSYDLGKGWAISAVVNNLFDKEYFSAGRLALNPFSPSINGAIGVSGFNFNSNEWRSTNSVAPAAPRAIWFAISYEFDPNRK